jgi:hypothetical protein
VALQRLNFGLAVRPGAERGVYNTVEVTEGVGWVNQGLIRIGGGIKVRNADVRKWSANEYDLTARTPVLAEGTPPPLPAPPGVRPRAAEGGVTYPVVVASPAVGSSAVVFDLALGTPTPTAPLTLSGRVDLLDTIVREGALALVGRKGSDEVTRWPSKPQIDVQVTALQNNRVRTRVPEIDLPWTADLRLSQNPQRLRVRGRVDLDRGSVYASVLGAPIEVQDGQADVSIERNPSTGGFEPLITFAADAETRLRGEGASGDMQDYQVYLRITGATRRSSPACRAAPSSPRLCSRAIWSTSCRTSWPTPRCRPPSPTPWRRCSRSCARPLGSMSCWSGSS